MYVLKTWERALVQDIVCDEGNIMILIHVYSFISYDYSYLLQVGYST